MKYFKYFNNKPLQSFVYFLDKKKKITMAPPSSGAQSFANDTGQAWKPRAAGHCDPCFWLAAPDGAPTHIPPELLVKEIVYFFHQKNKRRCTQQGGPPGRARAVFDLGSALIVKNYSVMD